MTMPPWRLPPLLSTLILICTAILLGGCGTKPTIMVGSITTAEDVNPDRRNRASPVTVRIYELKTPAVFEHADFFSLWDRESETLGGDLLGRDEIQLMPGETRQLKQTLQADTRHIAVIAAFRDLERAQWRITAPIVPNRTQALAIRLEARSVSISAP